MTVPNVSVIIVNFNAGGRLRQCLESLDTHLSGLGWDAIVVDNASIDGSADAIEGRYTRVRVQRNLENVGFGRAVNQGVRSTAGDLVLLINPDCEVRPGLVHSLWSELDAHPDCAIVGPRILDPDGSVQGSARGDPSLLTGLFGRSTMLTRVLPGSALARHNVRASTAIDSGASSVEVDWVSGACMLARRSALSSVGGFDERYFLYWEDADLCVRLRHHGHRIRYVPGAHVVHHVGASSRTAPAESIRAFHRSAYLYYATHRTPGALNPGRWLAWVILAIRCRWKLGRHRPGPPSPGAPAGLS